MTWTMTSLSDMNIKDTIANGRAHGAHRPFGQKDMVRAPDRPIDVATLTIASDPIPAIGLGNKYHELFTELAKQPAPRCVKAQPQHVMKIANSLRKWIKQHKLDMHVRTIAVLPNCPDRMGRVWLCDGPQTVISNAYRNKKKGKT